MMKLINKYLLCAFFLFCIIITLYNTDLVYGEEYNIEFQNKTREYVDNLLYVYNSRVNFYIDKQIINKYEKYLSLYSDVGQSFKILMVKQGNIDASYLALVFEPIMSNDPNILFDLNSTLYDYYPDSLIYFENTSWSVIQGIFENFDDTVRYDTVTLYIHSDDILNNPKLCSKSFAEYLFLYDKESVENAIKKDKILEKWVPFLEEHSTIISNYTILENIKLEFEQILIFSNYDYSIFITNFQIYEKILLHYEKLFLMNKEYNDFVSTYITERKNYIYRYCLENDDKINEYLTTIRNSINNNELYQYEDLVIDFDKLKYIIEKEINYLNGWFILITFIFGLGIGKYYDKLSKKIKNVITQSKKSIKQIPPKK